MGGNPEAEAGRQALLAKVCYAVWLLCEKNEVNQKAFRDAGGMPALVKMHNAQYDVTLLEMAAGALCALCEGFDSNKVAVRECDGVQPLIELLEYGTVKAGAERVLDVRLNAAKALMHLAENAENKALIRELGGLEKLVKLLSK